MVLNKSFKIYRRWRPARSVLVESKNIPEESLLFESGTLNVLTPAEADFIRKEYPDVETAYCCLGVLQGEGILYVAFVTECKQAGKLNTLEVYRITKTTLIPLHANARPNETVVEMGKLLGGGQFYFSIGKIEDGFSLMGRAQRKGRDDPQFFWNRGLYVYLQRFNIDCNKWLTSIICGSVLIQTIYAGNKQVKACLVSRMSCERTGTRFNVRGLDDEGQVANFVETEQIMFVDSSVVSFVQVRGTIPVFWDQPGIQTGTNRIRLSRGFHSSHPAFQRHYERLLKEYGPSLSLDLLGNRDMEPLLTESFKEHISELSLPGATQYHNFDYHLHCRPGHTEALHSILLPECQEFLMRCSYYLEEGGQICKGQTGVVRHNCLDCLDRSNNAQTLLGVSVLEQQLRDIGVVIKSSIVHRFVEQYKTLWAQNGDNISKFYAGTRALDGGKSRVGKLKDGARSVQRTIKNNFLDASKQEAIDMLLLNGYMGELGWRTKALLSPMEALAPLPIRKRLTERWLEYSKKDKLRVCIGTWNVNGGKHMRSVALKNQSLHDWLLDAPMNSPAAIEHSEDFRAPADIYAVGFQELVDLTASNLVSTSSSNRHEWAAELQRVLSRDTPYSLLTAEQLVGVCLYIFVRPTLVPFIRDVAVSSVKTGIGGKAGNKGGVAIRFLLNSTSLCFVCSHFAAHQSKVVERNNDFAEICKKVQFPHGQSVDSHDYVFWCGDLNYRIDLPGSLAKDTVTKREWDKLHKHEQLIKQKKLGRVFKGYAEGELSFAPTFKYDMFSDDYDTSEKARVPAWCDRILWKRRSFLPPPKHHAIIRIADDGIHDVGNGEFGWHPSTVQKVCERELSSGDSALQWWHPGRLLYYGRTELKTSDHRPVLALIEVDTFRVDEKEKKQALQRTLEDLGPPDATVVVTPTDSGEFNTIDNTQLVATLQQYGRIILVRSTNTCTLVTFNQSESAIAAASHTGKQIGYITVTVDLKQPEYIFTNNDNVSILTTAQLAQLYNTDYGDDEEGDPLEDPVKAELEAGLDIYSDEEDDESTPLEPEVVIIDEDDRKSLGGHSQDDTSKPRPKRPPPPPKRPSPTLSPSLQHRRPHSPRGSDSEECNHSRSSSYEEITIAIADTPTTDTPTTTQEQLAVKPRPPFKPDRPMLPLPESVTPSDTNRIRSNTSSLLPHDESTDDHYSKPRSHSIPPKPPSTTRPVRPVPPAKPRPPAPKKPTYPPRPIPIKPSTVPCPQNIVPNRPLQPSRPLPPSRPPPPYVKLYPTTGGIEEQSTTVQNDEQQHSDSSIEFEPEPDYLEPSRDLS